VWHDSFKCEAHAFTYTWHNSFVYVTWHIHTRNITHSHVWHDSFTRATWLILSFKRVTWLVLMYDMTHLTCNLTHSDMHLLIWMSHIAWDESCHIWERVIYENECNMTLDVWNAFTYMNKSYCNMHLLIWMSRIATCIYLYEWVILQYAFTYVNESYGVGWVMLYMRTSAIWL